MKLKIILEYIKYKIFIIIIPTKNLRNMSKLYISFYHDVFLSLDICSNSYIELV